MKLKRSEIKVLVEQLSKYATATHPKVAYFVSVNALRARKCLDEADALTAVGWPTDAFKTWQEASRQATREAVEAWMAAAMQECAEHGAKYGVIIGIQNHGDFIASGAQHLSLLARVNHRWCGAIVDTGKYVTADPYQDIAQVAPFAVNWQVKESPFGRADRPATDWKKLAAILRGSGYRGYVPIETLAMSRKDYDPYTLAAQVLRDLRNALAGA